VSGEGAERLRERLRGGLEERLRAELINIVTTGHYKLHILHLGAVVGESRESKFLKFIVKVRFGAKVKILVRT